jgi:phosphatidylinositol alpha-mannosyltransferase
MRVGLVCPYSLTTPGGVQGQVLGLARSLRNLGHDARVLGPCDGPPPDAGVTPLGRSVPTTANGSVAPIAPDPSCQLRTIRALRDETFDVLHLHEPLVPGPCMTSILFRNAPIIGTFHAAGGSAAYRYLKRPVRWLANKLDHRCAVSADARQMAHDALGGEYTLLFNGIEVDRFAKASPWPTDGPTIFFVGRHEPRKGLAVLLEAMRSLPSDALLWVAGDGPETAALQDSYRDDARIDWLGRIDDDEKAARLRGADVFCAPSLRGESFGVVLLEGMAAQTPVVASDLPGYHNVARSGADAILVPPGDPAALADALAKVLENPTCAERLVASGQQRAEEFSMDNLAARYVELYEHVA